MVLVLLKKVRLKPFSHNRRNLLTLITVVNDLSIEFKINLLLGQRMELSVIIIDS